MIKYSYSVVDSDSCNFILPHKKIRNLIVENLTLMPLSNFYNESYQVWPYGHTMVGYHVTSTLYHKNHTSK